MRSWRSAAIATAAAIIAVLVLHGSTVQALVSMWTTSRTFVHGIFIVPISLYLVWRQRRALADRTPRGSWWGVAAVALWGAFGFLSGLIHARVGMEFALVGLVISTVWAVLGTDVARTIAFPLAYLFFSVPIGEFLFPLLIRVTGTITAFALTLTGAPVVLRGNYLHLPGASWVVSDTCSGLRYLLVLLSVGALYAYLTYRSYARRAAFLGICVALSILTNGFRAWLVVMVGYMTDMKSPLVWDHAWLGWVLFALMATALFLIGSRWAERDGAPRPHAEAPRPASGHGMPSGAAALVVILVVGGWTAYAAAVASRPAYAPAVALTPPAALGGWTRSPAWPWIWRPRNEGNAAGFDAAYQRADRPVGVHVAYYVGQRQGAELIQARNVLVAAEDPTHRVVSSARRMTTVGARRLGVVQTDIRTPTGTLRTWHWYWVGGDFASSPTTAKLLELKHKVFGGVDAAADLVVSTPIRTEPEEASEELRRFLEAALPSLEGLLSDAAARGAGRSGS